MAIADFGQPEIVIAEIDGRKLVTDFRKKGIWDKSGYSEYWYLGRYYGDTDATCRWRGWLRSMGWDV